MENANQWGLGSRVEVRMGGAGGNGEGKMETTVLE